MTKILRIHDGTDEIDFTDPASGYELLNHTPAVARRESGNAELYSRVVEELEITVSGSTRAQITARVDALTEIIDRAVRLQLGENVAPVLYEYQVEDSALAFPLQALVIGPPPGESAVILPATYDSAFTAWQVGSQGDPLVLRFERRGGLLGAEETEISASINAGDVAALTFSAVENLPSPTKVFFQDIGTITATEDMPIGYIVVCQSDMIEKYEAESLTLSGFSSVSGAANFASGGNVAQSTAGDVSIDLNLTTDDINAAGRIACFVVAQVDAADTEWEMKFGLSGVGTNEYNFSRSLIFSDTTPKAILLGYVANSGFNARNARIKCDRLSGAGTLSIDYVILADVSSASFAAILLEGDIITGSAPVEMEILVDHALLTRANPQVVYHNILSPPLRPYVYRGNPIVHTKEDAISIVPMFTGGDSAARWRYGINGAVEAFTAQATRRPAYLVPR